VATRQKSPNFGGEQHTFQFRGTWVPPSAFRLLINRKVTTTQLAVLLIVDAFSNPNGEGCFASNKYIGIALDIQPTHVSHIVTKLIRMKLLKSKMKGIRRYLKAYWDKSNHSAGSAMYPSAGSATISNTVKKKNTLPGPERAGRGENSMGFIKTKTSIPKGVTPRHRILAKKLHKAVSEKTCLKRKANINVWAKEFVLLDKEASEERVDKVLIWYTANLQEVKKQAFCASSFRSKFADLEAMMGWWDKRTKTIDVNSVKITDQAKRASDRINNQRWDRGGENILPAAQVTIDSYTEFRKKLFKLKSKDKRLTSFIEHLLANLPGPVDFAVDWFEGVRHSNEWNPNWHGDLLKHTFNVESKQFQKLGFGISTQYGSYERWKQLMEVYRHENT
jgi:hypothetical protein